MRVRWLFESSIEVVGEMVMRLSVGEKEWSVSRGEVAVQGRELSFVAEVEGSGPLMMEVMEGALVDAEGRAVEATRVTREVTAACGPAALARREMDVCRCRRSESKCECACGGIGAAMEYWCVCL